MWPVNLCFSYAPNGLSIRKLSVLDNISQSEVEIKFSPDIPSQLNLLARCQRDHPFFVKDKGIYRIYFYYIPINDTTLELSVFWVSDTESQINELRFSESISLSFKTRLMSVTCFCGDIT